MRQSAEGEVVTPVPGDGGGGGDGMSDGETGSTVTVPSVVTGSHSAFDIQRGLGLAMSVQGVSASEERDVEVRVNFFEQFVYLRFTLSH